MALRAAAAAMARSATGFAPNAPGVFVRGFAGAVERFSGGQPVQTKRPAYDERDTPHTDKWLEVRAPTPSERTARARPHEPAPPHRTRFLTPRTAPRSHPNPLHPARPRAPARKTSRARPVATTMPNHHPLAAREANIRGADPSPSSRPGSRRRRT